MSADRASGGFGIKLREARERRGVSLRQIANATKISVSVLEALERNDISRLPGGIFGRAFVRSYAVEVGLDPEETIHDFIAQFPHDSVTAGHPTSKHVEDDDKLESDRRMVSTFLRLIVVSIPVVGVVLYFGTAGRRAQRNAASRPVAVTSAPGTMTSPQDAASAALETSPPTLAQPTATPPRSSPAAASGAHQAVTDRLTVQLSATRPCWVSATVDGQKAIDVVLQAGEARTVEVRRQLVLTAGDAAALTMTINGAATKPLGQAGQVVTVRLNPMNFREYLPAR